MIYVNIMSTLVDNAIVLLYALTKGIILDVDQLILYIYNNLGSIFAIAKIVDCLFNQTGSHWYWSVQDYKYLIPVGQHCIISVPPFHHCSPYEL